MKNILFLFTLLIYSLSASAQSSYRFTKGLVVSSGSRYGREAIYTDLLAYKLYRGELQTPTAGAFFSFNEKNDSIVWKAVEADSNGRFRRAAWRGSRTGNTFGNPGSVDRGADYLYLTYNSPKEQAAVLNIKGNSGLYFNGAPHTGDPYTSGWLNIPVKLKKGLNELYVRGANVVADLSFATQPVYISIADSTVPHIVKGIQDGKLQAAVVVVNTSSQPLKNWVLKSSLAGTEVSTTLPIIPAMSTRKVAFDLDAKSVTATGKFDCTLMLSGNNKTVDTKIIPMDAVEPTDKYSSTFVSEIDGSLQYYATTPQIGGDTKKAALFLSVHGAGVEAIGQARAYQSKDWGTLVAATNRRPRGFNWEDWGRLDALEVLGIAKEKFKPHPQHIYLTGHSMGGHGTWFLGATYPDKWAAIAPCAGYPSLKDYGSADGKIPDSSRIAAEQMLLRSGNQSDVLKLVANYRPLGVYIHHGDSDRVVPVTYARQMRKELAAFHPDFSYHEFPGGEHWFGGESVDWPPLFQYFKQHTRLADSAVNEIDFTTSSPGISSTFRWASIYQQAHPLQYSRIVLHRNLKNKSITGNTENVHLLQLALGEFGNNTQVKITLDSTTTIQYTTTSANDSLFIVKTNDKWSVGQRPTLAEKGPHRYGTFKEAFNYKMVFVYGTTGTKEENEWNYNKAIYDAETWYYRGNGAMDIISDKEYQPATYSGRNIIIYGNASTNSAYNILLKNCPVQIARNSVKAGANSWQGDDLAAYFVWPQADGKTSVGVIAGTGIKGMQAAAANQYFAGASGFPDCMVFQLDMLKNGAQSIKLAGFFDNDWKFEGGDWVEND